MPACKECGTIGSSFGLKWNISRGQKGRVCGTCHASESQWPCNVSAQKVLQSSWFQEARSGRNDESAARPNPRCGHVCARRLTPHTSGCCCCTGFSAPCSECIGRRVASALMSAGTPADQAHEIQQRILQGIDGDQVTVSQPEHSERERRLASNVRTLFHQTAPQHAALIRQSSRMLRGSDGLAGGGIYFATNEQDTEHKAHSKGVMLHCRVRLGRVKDIPWTGDPSVTFRKLLKEGYDSVRIPRPGGDEYVVYNFDQVEVTAYKPM